MRYSAESVKYYKGSQPFQPREIVGVRNQSNQYGTLLISAALFYTLPVDRSLFTESARVSRHFSGAEAQTPALRLRSTDRYRSNRYIHQLLGIIFKQLFAYAASTDSFILANTSASRCSLYALRCDRVSTNKKLMYS